MTAMDADAGPPPVYEIDPQSFWADPYPDLARMRARTPIARVPQLGSILITTRDLIGSCEKRIDVFSSHQPQGLMTVLMGENMMRKDGAAHQAEKKAIFPAVSPRTVRDVWAARFRADAERILANLRLRGRADLVADFAMPLSGDALRHVTGLENMDWRTMDRVSQAMIDGIANYAGDPGVEARCREATATIDAHIDERLATVAAKPDTSLLSVQLRAGLPMDSVRANVKLAISGGQNEPRDAIAGAIWALLTNPDQLRRVLRADVGWDQVFDEYVRWMSPIGMSPRRVARPHAVAGIRFQPDERVFLMFGSANRDEAHFADPDRFDVSRDASKHIAFGAGPHFCAGAAAARALIAGTALPMVFAALPGLRLAGESRISGWAVRGLLDLPVAWDA
jgi:cytochrome P450